MLTLGCIAEFARDERNLMTSIQDIAPITLRGRTFSSRELEIVQTCVTRYYERGRTYISKEICKALEWKQPNGRLKDRACRDVMRHLDSLGVIKLPPPLVVKSSSPKKQTLSTDNLMQAYDLSSPITDVLKSEIRIVFAKGNKYERLWNFLVERYHYLGHRVVVGRHIKYLFLIDNRILGAIGFSSPAWRLQPRDSLLARLGVDNPLDYTINNSRFLVLPNVKVKNLASYLLALATRQIVKDWTWYYSLTPLFAETFVQPSLFDGTCYKAANWIEIGTTKGYAKRGMFYRNSQEPKKIFIYGLNRRLRRQIFELLEE